MSEKIKSTLWRSRKYTAFRTDQVSTPIKALDYGIYSGKRMAGKYLKAFKLSADMDLYRKYEFFEIVVSQLLKLRKEFSKVKRRKK